MLLDQIISKNRPFKSCLSRSEVAELLTGQTRVLLQVDELLQNLVREPPLPKISWADLQPVHPRALWLLLV